jgi:hypothetical protein
MPFLVQIEQLHSISRSIGSGFVTCTRIAPQ